METQTPQETIKKTVRMLIIFAAIGAVALCLRMVSGPDVYSADSGYRQVMGTFAHIVGVGINEVVARSSVEAAFAKLKDVDQTMSDYIPESQLSQLNRDGFKQPVKVSDELFEVLSQAIGYSKLSDGAFDVTVGPLVELWRQAGDEGKRPTDEEISNAQSKVGYEKLVLDKENKTVRFLVEGMKVDLGGIAKGFAIDQAVAAMKEKGALGGMIDVGGDIGCFGITPKEEKLWRVGLQDPKTENVVLLVLKLESMAIATSGDYRRFTVIEDEKISHIISPETSTGAKKTSSVTIIAPSAMQADALATVVSVMGPETGLKLIESIEGVEALVIPTGEDQDIARTKGIGRYIDTSKTTWSSSASQMIMQEAPDD